MNERLNDEEQAINFLTFVDVQDAPDHDSKAVSSYIEDQSSKEIIPAEVYGDTHYNSSANIENLAKDGIGLKGPVLPVPQNKAAIKNQGFEADFEGQKITCPAGHETKIFTAWANGKVAGSFDKADCSPCERQEVCLPEKRGKRIAFRVESDLLKSRRAMMETKEFKVDMHKRNGIEGTISGIVRGQGMRRSRFRGKNKARLQIKMSGAAANISRLHRTKLVALSE